MVTFRVLGPLSIVVNGRPAAIRSRRQRAVLAMLLANGRTMIPIDRLLRALWADDPPDTAVGQIQTVIWRLRGLLGETAILTHPGGYELAAGAFELDAEWFATRADRAGELMRRGRLEEAAAVYDDALALWRGRPFADVTLPGDPHGSGFQAALAELCEQRVAAERQHIDVRLALGRHADLVPLLRQRAAEEPLREELRERLMLALYRTGRRAEALDAFREARAISVAELGLEPGPGLQRLNRLILAGDSTLDTTGAAELDTPPPPRPAMLPMDIPDFVARTELACKLAAKLTGPAETAPTIVAISGAAGTGKTSLAVHVAHLVRQEFADGQLFADLRGVDRPLDPAEVLARFLRALGEDARGIPADPDERAALFRARTAGRRVLVVLDNAAGEAQLRRLLPADPGCAVIVTSRRRLAALLGAQEVDVGVFEPGEALDLLRQALGPERVAGELQGCLVVAERCGYLPLAIRVAAARLAARPHWPVGRMAAQLAGESGRLDALSTRDLAVRASVVLSVEALDPLDRRLFGLLGTVDAGHLPAWSAGPLLDLPAAAAEEPLERLVEARLVEVAWGRYHMHDLVRDLARERAPSDHSGLRRLCGAWLTLADAAYERMPGGFRRVAELSVPGWSGWRADEIDLMLDDPVGWCEAERGGLVAAVRLAAGAGEAGLAWNLAVTVTRFLELREYLEDWRITHDAALRACVEAGDRTGEAYMLRGLGELNLNLDRFGDALAHLDPALSIMDELGDRPGQAAVLRAIGSAHRSLGRETEAMAALGRARVICGELGDRPGEAQLLHLIGAVHRMAGRLAEAQAAYTKGLEIFEALGDRFGQSYTLCSVGVAAGYQPDRVAEAERCLRQSLDLSREFGYRRGEAIALGNLGWLFQRSGRPEAAGKELAQAIMICREIGDRHGEATELRRLGQVYLDMGRALAARGALQRSLAIARELGSQQDQDEALSLLGRT